MWPSALQHAIRRLDNANEKCAAHSRNQRLPAWLQGQRAAVEIFDGVLADTLTLRAVPRGLRILFLFVVGVYRTGGAVLGMASHVRSLVVQVVPVVSQTATLFASASVYIGSWSGRALLDVVTAAHAYASSTSTSSAGAEENSEGQHLIFLLIFCCDISYWLLRLRQQIY